MGRGKGSRHELPGWNRWPRGLGWGAGGQPGLRRSRAPRGELWGTFDPPLNLGTRQAPGKPDREDQGRAQDKSHEPSVERSVASIAGRSGSKTAAPLKGTRHAVAKLESIVSRSTADGLLAR